MKTIGYIYNGIEELETVLQDIRCPDCNIVYGDIDAIEYKDNALNFYAQCDNNHKWILSIINIPQTIVMLMRPALEQFLGTSNN